MATFIATNVYDNSSSTTIVITKPTGTADDDIMFALLKRVGQVDPTGTPTGWTLEGTGNEATSTSRYWLYRRVAASEGADYTWTWAALARSGGTIATYRGGFNIADPIDVVSNTGYTTSDTILRAASMVVAAANSSLIFLGGGHFSASQTYTAPTVPGTWVEDHDSWNSGSRFAREICSMVWSSSGATGNMDATISATAQAKHAFAVALKPAAGGAAVTSYDRGMGRGLSWGMGSGMG